MRSARRVWWTAAGLLLVTAGPALAQGQPGAAALPDDVPDGFPPPVTARPAATDAAPLPAPRPVVTPPAAVVAPVPQATAVAAPAGRACAATADGPWFWQRGRAAKHADCQAHMWGYPEEFEAPP